VFLMDPTQSIECLRVRQWFTRTCYSYHKAFSWSRACQMIHKLGGLFRCKQLPCPSWMLHRQVSANPAFTEIALDIAARGNREMNSPYFIVGMFVKAGVALHNAHLEGGL